MKKMLMLSGLVTVLAACGGTDIGEERTVDETSLATIESRSCGALAGEKCAMECPTGYYIQKYNCYTSVSGAVCSGCNAYTTSFTKNAVSCSDIPDGSCGETVSYYWACGTSSPPSGPHYLYGYAYISDCAVNYPGNSSVKNRTGFGVIPAPGPLVGFNACGTSCPGGFNVYSQQYNSGCSLSNPAPSTGANNQVTCRSYNY